MLLKYPNFIQDHRVLLEFRKLINSVNDVQTQAEATAKALSLLHIPTLAEIQQALTLGGSNPINVTGLLGILAQVQVSAQSGTHAQRLLMSPILGVQWWETDRTVMYVAIPSGAATIWHYESGTMYSAFANRPADLGVNDAGFRFVDSTTDTQAEWIWTGTEFVTIDYLQEVDDAATVTVTTLQVLRHLTSAAAGNGFGSQVIWSLENAGGTAQDAALMQVFWDVATAGNEGARVQFNAMRGGAAAASILSMSRAQAIINGTVFWFNDTGFNGQLFHANSANRVYNFPNATGDIPYETTGAGIVDNNVVLGGGGALIKDSGHAIFGSSPYTPTNVTPQRSFDAVTGTLSDALNVLGTLIADLQTKAILT